MGVSREEVHQGNEGCMVSTPPENLAANGSAYIHRQASQDVLTYQTGVLKTPVRISGARGDVGQSISLILRYQGFAWKARYCSSVVQQFRHTALSIGVD